MALGKRNVVGLYDADGHLHIQRYEGKAAGLAKKKAKQFTKELDKFEKAFADYESMDITSAKLDDVNTRYIMKKLGIVGDYADFIKPQDMLKEGYIDAETAAVAGNKAAAKLPGFSAKAARIFQPFIEKQAEKHPGLKSFSEKVTKAANNGRLPLTADSAAMMRIAFDRKYYNDVRKPGADMNELKKTYERAVENLMEMADHDGVKREDMSNKLGEKILEQSRYDDKIKFIYDGLATGYIRQEVTESYEDAANKTKFKPAQKLVDADGTKIDPLNLVPREPCSIEEIIENYRDNLGSVQKSCKSEIAYRKMLASPTFDNLEKTAKALAEADCPDEAEKFAHEKIRANIALKKQWGQDNKMGGVYENIAIPPPYEFFEKSNDMGWMKNYSTRDYVTIDSKSDEAKQDIIDDKINGKSKEEQTSDIIQKQLSEFSQVVSNLQQQLGSMQAQLEEMKRQRDAAAAEAKALQDKYENGRDNDKAVDLTKPEQLDNTEAEAPEPDQIISEPDVLQNNNPEQNASHPEILPDNDSQPYEREPDFDYMPDWDEADIPPIPEEQEPDPCEPPYDPYEDDDNYPIWTPKPFAYELHGNDENNAEWRAAEPTQDTAVSEPKAKNSDRFDSAITDIDNNVYYDTDYGQYT